VASSGVSAYVGSTIKWLMSIEQCSDSATPKGHAERLCASNVSAHSSIETRKVHEDPFRDAAKRTNNTENASCLGNMLDTQASECTASEGRGNIRLGMNDDYFQYSPPSGFPTGYSTGYAKAHANSL